MPAFLGKESEFTVAVGMYQPVLADRRGELIAWLLATGSAAGTILHSLRLAELSVWGLGLTVFLILTGATITFANWLDRRTWIRLTSAAIEYSSPLRKQGMDWADICRLDASRVGNGWRITVRSEDGQFSFRTSSSLRFGSSPEFRLGFPEGEGIARTVRLQAGLSHPIQEGGVWVCSHR